MVNVPFRWEPMGYYLESGHLQVELHVEMRQSDDIQMPHPIAQLEGELRQVFQQDTHQLDQYVDWLFDQMGQEGSTNDDTLEEELTRAALEL